MGCHGKFEKWCNSRVPSKFGATGGMANWADLSSKQWVLQAKPLCTKGCWGMWQHLKRLVGVMSSMKGIEGYFYWLCQNIPTYTARHTITLDFRVSILWSCVCSICSVYPPASGGIVEPSALKRGVVPVVPGDAAQQPNLLRWMGRWDRGTSWNHAHSRNQAHYFILMTYLCVEKPLYRV